MELGSVFDGPLSSGEKSDRGLSVWQAEVALRLSKRQNFYSIPHDSIMVSKFDVCAGENGLGHMSKLQRTRPSLSTAVRTFIAGLTQ